MNLSCSAGKVACLTDNGVWTTTLCQALFTTGYANCSKDPAILCKESVPVASARQDVVCVNIQPDPVHEVKKIDTPGCSDATTVALQYGGVRIALADDFNEQTLKRVLLTLRETLC